MSERGIRWMLLLFLGVEAALALFGAVGVMPWLVVAMSLACALAVVAIPAIGALTSVGAGVAIVALAPFEPAYQVLFGAVGIAIAVLGYELYRLRVQRTGIRAI